MDRPIALRHALRKTLPYGAVTAAALLLAACGAMRSGTGSSSMGTSPMSFFITSTNPGKGGDLGGLAGADRHCQALAESAGAGKRTWRAYLSNAALAGQPAVDARDRIGAGPWRNAKGVVVATSVADLHSAGNKLGKDTSLTEKGEVVPGGGDPVNKHDILTGSGRTGPPCRPSRARTQPAATGRAASDGSAIVGHHDRTGINPDPVANASWNSSHGTRGCSLDAAQAERQRRPALLLRHQLNRARASRQACSARPRSPGCRSAACCPAARRPAPPAARRAPGGLQVGAAAQQPGSRAASRAAPASASPALRSPAGRARPTAAASAIACSARRQLHRFGAFGLAQVAVARRQREAVVGAPGFAGHDLDRQRELPHHVAHHHQLLVVLLAEHRDARAARSRSSFITTVHTPTKKPGRKWPSRMSASAGSRVHLVGLRLGVERLLVGREQHVAAGRRAASRSRFPGARVACRSPRAARTAAG